MIENPATSPSSGDQLKPFACPACTSRFTRQENLNRHTASVHRRSNLRPFPCPRCDVSFSRSDLRKRHVRRYHLHESSPEESRVSDTQGKASSLLPEQSLKTAQSFSHITVEIPPTTNNFSTHNISWLFKLPQFVAAYFQEFQVIMPIIHQPTFDATAAPEALLQAVACVGAVYHSGGDHHEISVGLMEAGLQTLDSYVAKNGCAGFREIWVLQAYLLFEYFAFHSCEDNLFPTALSIHRKLVDAARQYQLLQDSVALGIGTDGSPSSSLPFDVDLLLSNPSVDRDWQLAIRSESRKRAMYALYYLDIQFSITCNLRPHLTALEIKYELPSRDDLWSAPTSAEWHSLILLSHDPGPFNEEADDHANGDPRPSQGDLYATLMFLMCPAGTIPPATGQPQPLGLLWHSSFATLMLIMQIQMMVRDLTIGSTFLYHNIRPSSFFPSPFSFPPSPSDPSTTADQQKHLLSILPEHSRAQVKAALDSIADVMPWPSSSSSTHYSSPSSTFASSSSSALASSRQWTHVQLAWYYTLLSLTHHDGLLCNGIVEYSVPSAVSTAWELGKPRSKRYRDIYEDRDVMRVAGALEGVLRLLCRPEEKIPEDPFVTVLGYKACLMGWRLVRLVALRLHGDGGDSDEGGGVAGRRKGLEESIYAVTAKAVVERILAAMGLRGGLSGGGRGGKRRESSGAATIDGDTVVDATTATTACLSSGYVVLNDAEAQYLEGIEAMLSKRNVWPAAGWITAVFAETRPGSIGRVQV